MNLKTPMNEYCFLYTIVCVDDIQTGRLSAPRDRRYPSYTVICSDNIHTDRMSAPRDQRLPILHCYLKQ
jgi:hypothetical protein